MTNLTPLAPGLLFTPCDPESLGFRTTADLPDLEDSFGQARAHEAIRFSMGVLRPGFNPFVLGEPGSGRHATVRRILDAQCARQLPPGDWCYVNNFSDPSCPRALPLPAGRGAQLRDDMQKFVADLGPTIAAAFESDEYRGRIDGLQEEYKTREEEALRHLGQASSEQGIALLRTPHGFVFAPMKDGEAMDPEAFEALADDEKQRLDGLMQSFHEQLHKLLHQFPRWRRELQKGVRDASRDALRSAVGHLVEEIKEHYTDLLNVLSFLDQVLQDVVEVGEELREQPRQEKDLASVLMSGTISLQRYQVNLLVDNRAAKCAPLIHEDHPNYANLVGRVDQQSHLGTLVSNFTMIRAGALHRANGGYLVLDAIKVLLQPYAWDGLKRALRSGQVRIESWGQMLGIGSSVALEPEPIPLRVKVILIGTAYEYYVLRELDPEFAELFKVAADFESDVARDASSVALQARLVATLGRAHGLRPFDCGAVARLVEQSAREAQDADKLSTRTRWLADLMCEADHRAALARQDTVLRDDVVGALRAREQRADRLRNRVREAVLHGTLLIDTGGAQVGQINGLAVVDPGESAFGHPVRITATARLGDGDVIDIEREAELGGAIHSKGVMILSSFLAMRYSRNTPLSVAASLVFEQSYGPVEGDSASLAELCALLSALAALPIRQCLAVTGSVNQYGQVQAIGGVNEKIEGFFDVCAARGLSGDHGVIIPLSNVRHLMLREEVVAAVGEGKFHVWAVGEVDQALEILTGVPAGAPDEEGIVPPGSINYLVAAQLAQMSLMRQSFAQGAASRRKPRRRHNAKSHGSKEP